MSETNQILGGAGVGVTVTLKPDRELELEVLVEEKQDELDERSLPPRSETETPEQKAELDAVYANHATLQAALVTLETELAYLKTEPHKTLTFMPTTPKKMAAFEEWLEERARTVERAAARSNIREARRLRKQAQEPEMDADAQRELNVEAYRLERMAVEGQPALNAAITRGEYSFSEQHAVESMGTKTGFAKLMQLLLIDKHPDMTVEACIKILDVPEYVELVTDAARKVNDLGKNLRSGRKKRTKT